MNNSNEWRKQFENRLLEFAVRIIKLANQLPKTPAGFAIASQLIRAASSIGANYVESQDASSTRHFIEKLSIALREARETYYWLSVILRSNLLFSKFIAPELTECNEIIAILSKSVKSSKLKLK